MAGIAYGVTGRLGRVVRMCVIAACGLGVLVLLFLLLSAVVQGAGIAIFRPLERVTGYPNWPTAVSAGLFCLFLWTAAAGLVLTALRWMVRLVLLLRSYPSDGVVAYVGQTGSSIGAMPTMRVRLQVRTPSGPVEATIKEAMDVSRIPRLGETVPLQVSYADPTAIRLR